MSSKTLKRLRRGCVARQGTASAIFTTVRDANVNVIMISQASSEHSVCFAVKQSEAASAVTALNSRRAPGSLLCMAIAWPGPACNISAACRGLAAYQPALCMCCALAALVPASSIFLDALAVFGTRAMRTANRSRCVGSEAHPPRPRLRRFGEAIRAGRISKVEQIDHCCVLAAVGHQMASRKGVAATMFSALAKANINIRRGAPPWLQPAPCTHAARPSRSGLRRGRQQGCRPGQAWGAGRLAPCRQGGCACGLSMPCRPPTLPQQAAQRGRTG